MAVVKRVPRGHGEYPAYYTCLSSDTKPTTATAGDIVSETDTGSKFEYIGNSWVQVSSGGAGFVSVRNAALTTQQSATGGEVTINNTTPASLGDMSAFGVPFGSIILTSSGSTDTHTIQYVIGNGKCIFFHDATGATDSVTVSATTSAGDSIPGPLVLIDSSGSDSPVTAMTGTTAKQYRLDI